MRTPTLGAGRVLQLATWLTLASGAPFACQKQGQTQNPDAPGGGGGGKQAADGVEFRYSMQARKLKTHADLQLTQSGGGQFAEAAIEVGATLELQPQGQALKVAWKIDDIAKLELKGMLQPKDASEDPKATLVERGKGAFVVDVQGEVDDKASEGLAENEARKKELEEAQKSGKPPGTAVQLLALMPAALALPSLPEKPLKMGEAVAWEETDEVDLQGMVMPLESARKYTLVKIDETGGSRIAEIAFEVEASGATEVQGGNMLTLDSNAEGTIVFNLDAGVPVSYEATRTDVFAVSQFSGETTTVVKARWEPAS